MNLYCSECGVKLDIQANFCFKCGTKALHLTETAASVAVESTLDINPSSVDANQLEINYAGFWQRAVATFIDVVLWVVFSLAVAFLPIDEEFYGVMGFIIAWMYYGLLDSSSWQGTIGKKVMNIAVCDLDGNRISFLRASTRYFLHILSYIILFFGYLMVVFTRRKQALHDMISGCVVVKKY